jgi:hypothetical protein
MSERKMAKVAISFTSALLIAALIVAGVFLVQQFAAKPLEKVFVMSEVQGPNLPQTPVTGVDCPDNRQTVVTINVRNVLNTSGQEIFDMNAILTDLDTGTTTEITDTTAGTVTLSCGHKYKIQGKSADGASGDNSCFVGIDGTPGAKVNPQVSGCDVTFTTVGQAFTLNLQGTQHATLEYRVFDNEANAFLDVAGSDVGTGYQQDGTDFESSTDGSAFAIGAGDDFSLTFYIRTVQADTEFSDRGTIIALVLPTTVYDKPSLTWDGQPLTEVGASALTSEEQRALTSTYQYFYLLPPNAFNDIRNPRQIVHKLELNGRSLPNVDPGTSDDIQVDFIARGAYESISGIDVVKVGARDDSSSFNPIFATMDFGIQVR